MGTFTDKIEQDTQMELEKLLLCLLSGVYIKFATEIKLEKVSLEYLYGQYWLTYGVYGFTLRPEYYGKSWALTKEELEK